VGEFAQLDAAGRPCVVHAAVLGRGGRGCRPQSGGCGRLVWTCSAIGGPFVGAGRRRAHSCEGRCRWRAAATVTGLAGGVRFSAPASRIPLMVSVDWSPTLIAFRRRLLPVGVVFVASPRQKQKTEINKRKARRKKKESGTRRYRRCRRSARRDRDTALDRSRGAASAPGRGAHLTDLLRVSANRSVCLPFAYGRAWRPRSLV